jgi:hypothetical protein
MPVGTVKKGSRFTEAFVQQTARTTARSGVCALGVVTMNSFDLRQRRNRLILWAGDAVALCQQMPPDMQFLAVLLIVLAALFLGQLR